MVENLKPEEQLEGGNPEIIKMGENFSKTIVGLNKLGLTKYADTIKCPLTEQDIKDGVTSVEIEYVLMPFRERQPSWGREGKNYTIRINKTYSDNTTSMLNLSAAYGINKDSGEKLVEFRVGGIGGGNGSIDVVPILLNTNEELMEHLSPINNRISDIILDIEEQKQKAKKIDEANREKLIQLSDNKVDQELEQGLKTA